MITIKNIDTDKAIEYIFCTRRFPVLKTHLEDLETKGYSKK